LPQRYDCTFQANLVHRAGEVGDDEQRGDAEVLAEIEATAEVVEMAALFALRQQQPALVRRGGERHAAIVEQLARVGGGSAFRGAFRAW
jgi:hypothetical protein